MGIYEFYSTFVNKLGPGITRQRIPVEGVEGLSIDLNGLIHAAAQKSYMYGAGRGDNFDIDEYVRKSLMTHRELEDDFIITFQKMLNDIITSFRPKQYIILASDGVAPGAKIAQQRQRRYKEAALSVESSEFARSIEGAQNAFKDAEKEYRRVKQGGPSSALVGDLVSNMSESEFALNRQKEYLSRSIREIGADKLPPVGNFTSSVISPGTPFMERLHLTMESWSQSANASHGTLPPTFVYSGVGIAGEGEHKIFSFLREYFEDRTISQGTGAHVIYGKDSDLTLLSLLCPLKRIFLSREDPNDCINIDALFVQIRSFMTDDGKAPSAKFDDATIKRDFVVISMLIGNDFLPKILSVDGIRSGSLNETYAKLGSPLTVERNVDVCRELGTSRVDIPSGEIVLPTLGNFLFLLAKNEPQMLAKLAVGQMAPYDPNIRDTYYGKSAALQAAYDPSSNTVDMKKLRGLWYSRLGEIRDGPENGTLESTIRDMTSSFIGMMSWVLRYYTVGGCGVNWASTYSYVGAPFLIDLADSIVKYMKRLNADQNPPDSLFLVSEPPAPQTQPRPTVAVTAAISRPTAVYTATSAAATDMSASVGACDASLKRVDAPISAIQWQDEIPLPSSDSLNQGQWIREFQNFLFKVLTPVFPNETVRRTAVTREMMGTWIQAVTTPTIVDRPNYETLETLGDKTMGFEFAMHVFRNRPNVTPQELTYFDTYYMSKVYQSELSDLLKLKYWVLVSGDRAWVETEKSRTDFIEAFCAGLAIVSTEVHRTLIAQRHYELAACATPKGSEAVGTLIQALFSNRPLDDSLARNSSKTIILDINTLFGKRTNGGIAVGNYRDRDGVNRYFVRAASEIRTQLQDVYGITIPVELAEGTVEREVNDKALALLENAGITTQWMNERRDEMNISFLSEDEKTAFKAKNRSRSVTKVIFEVPAAIAAAFNSGQSKTVTVVMVGIDRNDNVVFKEKRESTSVGAAKRELLRAYIHG